MSESITLDALTTLCPPHLDAVRPPILSPGLAQIFSVWPLPLLSEGLSSHSSLRRCVYQFIFSAYPTSISDEPRCLQSIVTVNLPIINYVAIKYDMACNHEGLSDFRAISRGQHRSWEYTLVMSPVHYRFQ